MSFPSYKTGKDDIPRTSIVRIKRDGACRIPHTELGRVCALNWPYFSAPQKTTDQRCCNKNVPIDYKSTLDFFPYCLLTFIPFAWRLFLVVSVENNTSCHYWNMCLVCVLYIYYLDNNDWSRQHHFTGRERCVPLSTLLAEGEARRASRWNWQWGRDLAHCLLSGFFSLRRIMKDVLLFWISNHGYLCN